VARGLVGGTRRPNLDVQPLRHPAAESFARLRRARVNDNRFDRPHRADGRELAFGITAGAVEAQAAGIAWREILGGDGADRGGAELADGVGLDDGQELLRVDVVQEVPHLPLGPFELVTEIRPELEADNPLLDQRRGAELQETFLEWHAHARGIDGRTLA